MVMITTMMKWKSVFTVRCEGSDGKMETRLLIAALADHIQAQELATREEATHDATDTHH